MSLLLEALKKAELAKQIAKAESPSPAPAAETASPEPTTRVITREKLPDITQSLEILTDDLPSSEQKPTAGEPARPELSLQEPQAFEPTPLPASSIGEPARIDEHERAQAQQLFQVKEMDYNPRRPFYFTLGALALVAVGYGGYVWWQMRPHYSFSSAAAQAPTVAAAPVQAAAAPPPVQAPSPPVAAAAEPVPAPIAPSAAAPSRGTIPGIPPIQPVRPPRQRAASAPVAVPPAIRPEPAAPAFGQASDTPIAVNTPILGVDPLVEQGYQQFQRNDLAAARDSYQRALAREPRSRDALLGLAAIDVRNGELESAESRYLKLLEIDPRDSQAVAGLVTLRGRLDPVASESRLKTLLVTQPEAAHLHFSLGNQYAQQSRWNEAQAAYFKAYSIDPENADYAFNLAVSLDQLRQKRPALEYYQRALTLAEKRTASFNPAQARLRIQELSK